MATLVLVVAVGVCGAAVGAYTMVTIPAPHPEAVMQSAVFLDVHGDYLGRRGPVDRQEVPLSRVPRFVQDAVIAAENRTFRTDSGIAPTSIARATLAAITGGARQGGSTITQQYIKNALLTPEQSLSRKVREALIAVKLDRTRSKDEILQGYLNTVYFGRGAAGIQAAARNYFGIDVNQLTLAQGAALAAIINLPSYYERAGSDPKVTATLQSRWAWVLNGMVTSHTITKAQRAAVAFPAFRFYPPGPTEGQRQYLIDAAAAEATDKLGITEEQLDRGGYIVHTTFDLALQDTATQAVRAYAAAARPRPGASKIDAAAQLHTPIVAMVPGNGAIRLLYGGTDYAHQPFDDALNGSVEVGTALAPLGMARLHPPLDRLQETPAPTVLQVAAGYAAVAANGRYATPYMITTITQGNRTLYTAHPASHRALSTAAVQAITRGLHSPAPGGPPNTHTGRAADRSAWATGFGPHLAIAVALFAQYPAAGKKPAKPATLSAVTGSRPSTTVAGQIAAAIWASTASAAPTRTPLG
jgi:membrane peptidoglycan carboxypeptidase